MKHAHALPHPAGAKRVTRADGIRVWVLGELEFNTKRDLFDYFSTEAKLARVKAAQEALPQPSPNTVRTPDLERESEVTA
jgi:hypothetical protein